MGGYYVSLVGNYITNAQNGIIATATGYNTISSNSLNNNSGATITSTSCASLGTTFTYGICVYARDGTTITGNRFFGYNYGIVANAGVPGGGVVNGNTYTTVTVANTYAATKTYLVGDQGLKKYGLANADFSGEDAATVYDRSSSGYGFITAGTAVAWAPIHLPDGAILTDMECRVYDNDATYQVYTAFYRITRSTASAAAISNPATCWSGSATGCASLASYVNASVLSLTTQSVLSGSEVVDNSTYNYMAKFYASSATCGTLCRIYSCELSYYDGPN
jgi:hypothetical protein